MEAKKSDPLIAAKQAVARVPGIEPGFDVWWGLVAAVAGLVVLLAVGWPNPFGRILLFIADGIQVTLFATVTSFLLVMVVGLIGGLARLSRNKIIYGAATLYVEVVRGIPLLVQIIFWYFAFPSIVQNIGRAVQWDWLANYRANEIAMAVLGLTVCYGAYLSEVYRAGIQSIPKGQLEAARSLGMTYLQAMRHVILPQAVRVILPPVGNEFVSLLKDSSLVSAVAISDLTRRGREFMSQEFMPVETWTMVALVYLVMTLLAARVAAWIERKTRFER